VRIEASIRIEAPPDVVWTIATDPTLAPRWNANVTQVSDVSVGPVSVGTRWTQIVRVMGRDQRMQAEVIESDPPQHGVVRLTGPGDPLITTTVHADGAASILSQVMDFTVPPGLTGVGLRLGAPLIKEQLHEALRRQKQAAEEAALST
jgi:uncharacterized protein YndB with AHSA1/START domain